MRGTAVVLGATGQVGHAAVRRLAEEGWHVRAVSRGLRPSLPWPPDLGVEPVLLDRESDGALAGGVGRGCEVLVDCTAFHARHAHQLRALGDRIGSAVVISSFMVYTDGAGCTFNATPQAFPVLPVPVAETHPTIAPGEDTYAGGKAALERALLDECAFPVTLLRAGMIHGVSSSTPREWYFVKRALDGRGVRLLAYRGLSRCHPTATVNLAELIRLAAAHPGSRVLNAGDPQVPTVSEIAACIDAVLGHEAEEILLDGPGQPGLGVTPWSVPHPIVLSMRRAERELGYRPVIDYAAALPETIDWLVNLTRHRDWREVFPKLARRWDMSGFDYAAEDRWLAHRRLPGGR